MNGDGYDDVVVGADGWNGKVRVAYGSAAGTVRVATSRPSTRTCPASPARRRRATSVGSAVSVADVTGDGFADIALGIAGEDVGNIADAGSVALVPGSASGVTGTGTQVFHQNTAGVPGVAEKDDQFGATTALLDVDGDGHRDLAAGVHGGEQRQRRRLGAARHRDRPHHQVGPRLRPGDLSAPATNALFGAFLR